MTCPHAPRLPVVTTLHGHDVPDPYRWLEDPAAPETLAWLAAQEDLWRAHARTLPWRDRFRRRLAELGAVGAVTPPVWRGGRRFWLRRTAGQEHPVLHLDEDVLLDPMRLDPTGLTTLDEWQPDHDGRLLAYQVSRRGDERAELYVMDVAGGTRVDGPVHGCRYSPVAWLPGGRAFCYVRFREGVFLHRVGEPDDELLFASHPGASYGLGAGPGGEWLTVSAAPGPSAPNELWLLHPSTGELRAVQEAGVARSAAAVGHDGRLYVLTDRDAPRGRLCVADLGDPRTWHDLVPEDPGSVARAFTVLEDRLLVSRVRHAVAEIGVHDLATGRRVGGVELPGKGSVGSLTVRPEGGHEAWFTYTDAVTPPGVWRYDARENTTTPWAAPPGDARLPEVDSRQLTCVSADGTRVRLIVVARPWTGGPRPAILTGYGGFGVPLTPGYAADSLAWVEAGGVLAVAGIRGGGEEGEAWHRQGMREHKQNSFDDFAAAAEKLIADGWTTPAQLGLWGESNGGLLVGAMLTQRPELFAACVCAAPLLDMVRYERFGLGAAWRGEYGSAEVPEELAWLLAYSPYHRVRRGVPYPATLFTVAGGDTRVDPMHARKMCAALQWAGSPRPVLLRHEPDVGHGARAVSRSVDLAADALAFLAAHTGLSDPPGLPGDADGVDAAARPQLGPRAAQVVADRAPG
ncbi:prolyl oligopeptidase family serine peptidase [Thermoactinospora rubra]|uniref:prolyl oligopeptidase family serine peptidase n=1 Tax=Thermoactinospora rubra TaxID=1088767 RepID=UPI000A11B928|nr:prolyl oligopeptidase family serine peptidase [Thermoactinospora rubra]